MADSVEFSQPATSVAYRDATSEQPHGTLVSDALSNASRLSVPPRVQRMVLEPADGYDRGQSRVQ